VDQARNPEHLGTAEGKSHPTMTPVRTDTAKLIKYHEHPEWAELSDIEIDPYETCNLYQDSLHAALRIRLGAEHARLAREVG
jgi:hypothetical protein